MSGKLDRVGLGGTTLSWWTAESRPQKGPLGVRDGEPAAEFLIDWLEARQEFAAVSAVGHRVVHGMAHTEPDTSVHFESSGQSEVVHWS